MSLAYYFDHHVPSAIANGLRARGIDILTANEDGTSRRPDDFILQRATELGRLVFTQDHDFLVIAHRWSDAEREFAGVVFGHQMHLTIGQAVRDLEIVATVMEAADMRNRVEYLPLR